MSNFISFLLPHDISKFELNKEHSILQFLISPYMSQLSPRDFSVALSTGDSYDCVILNCGLNERGMLVNSYEQKLHRGGESSGTCFGDIYIKFLAEKYYQKLILL